MTKNLLAGNGWVLGEVQMLQPIFDRYGGFAKLSQVVSAFYERIIESPITSPYFDGVDMRRLVEHQTKFVASVTGGPASFSNDMLERVHAPYNITEDAFAEMANILRETLEDFGFADADIHHVCHQVSSRKHLVISRR